MSITRKQIDEECNSNIAKLQEELSLLEEKHKAFYNEDLEDDERVAKHSKTASLLTAIEEKFCEGNFGSTFNLNHQIIPQEFKYMIKSEYDARLVIMALRELYDEQKEKIKASKEYMFLSIKYDETAFWNFSKEHTDIHNKIIQIQSDIRFAQVRLRLSKGKFLTYCKERKQQERMELKQKEKEEKIKKFKEMIKKAGEIQ